MFSPRLLDHFRNPRFPGSLDPPAVTVEVSNPACGDLLRLSARFEGGVAAEVRFLVRGCTASVAAASALTVLARGRRREELARIDQAAIESELDGLPPASSHAAVLAIDALRELLARI
ncbi:MAG: iron-sulfur cluster assembly scaffold protein [Acidobacteria bacterium]|nr:iron-sulfur cluster assembly scaffold protein [Acidobacteriota bacterium]